MNVYFKKLIEKSFSLKISKANIRTVLGILRKKVRKTKNRFIDYLSTIKTILDEEPPGTSWIEKYISFTGK